MKTLVGSAYSPNVTKLDKGAFGGTGGKPDRITGSEGVAILNRPRLGPLRTAPTPFRLTANVPLNILQANPHRKGLLIQNKDAVANLFVAFGVVADASSKSIAAGGFILLDFVTPTDAVWLFATANISGVVEEYAPLAV